MLVNGLYGTLKVHFPDDTRVFGQCGISSRILLPAVLPAVVPVAVVAGVAAVAGIPPAGAVGPTPGH